MAYHHFLSIKRDLIDENSYIESVLDDYFDGNNCAVKSIKVNDKIILCLAPMLAWINTEWYSGEVKKGIDYYGRSKIKEDINLLKNILSATYHLLEYYPNEIIYKKQEDVKIKKEELMNCIDSLIQFISDSMINNFYILHIGI